MLTADRFSQLSVKKPMSNRNAHAPTSAASPRVSLTSVLLAANIAALVAVAIVFRCRFLSNIPGLNGDEAWYGVAAWEMLHGENFSPRTPTGNLLNPLMFIPAVLLHACFRPSVLLLRIVPLCSGLAALAVNWWMCRRIFDRSTAVVSTLILALLPIDIAYSRFAWDASQSLLATLPVWLFSLAAVRFPARRDAATAAAIACLVPAILVHPTNIFAAAAIAASMATGWRQWRLDRRRLVFLAIAALALVVWGTCLLKAKAGGHLTDRLRELVLPGEHPHFTILYANLFSGETVYEYIAGSHSLLRWPALGSWGQIGIGVVLVWTILLASAWRLVRLPKAYCREASDPLAVSRLGGADRDASATGRPRRSRLGRRVAVAVGGFSRLGRSARHDPQPRALCHLSDRPRRPADGPGRGGLVDWGGTVENAGLRPRLHPRLADPGRLPAALFRLH